MNKSVLVLLFIAFYSSVYCQLSDGSVAPDIDVVDINGNSYSLYAMMGSNKSACLDFSATWCGPCWDFHQSGVLESVYNNLGAYTTVLFLEADWNTNTNCLYGPSGCNSSTQGNWVAGTPYQIADLSATNGPFVNSDYQIAYYPTLYVISPDKRTWEIKDRSYQNYSNWITKSFALAATPTLTNSSCGDNGKIIMNVTGGYSTLTYKWSNGATTKDLNNIPGGTYSVTITDANTYYKEYGPYVITGPAKRVDVISSNLVHVKCYNDATGSISIQVDYGTPPYSFNWSNGNKTNFNDNLKAGNYTVTVTDKNACTRVKSYTLNQPADIVITTTSGKDNCNHVDGYISTKTVGGVPPYLYNIGDGDQQSPYFSDLKGGRDYTITVTDVNGCTDLVKTYVDVTDRPKVNAGSDKPLDCIKDIINLDGSLSDQGSSLINLWTTVNGNILKGAESLTPDVNKPGMYYLKITDLSNKCFDIDSAMVIDKRVFPNISVSRDTTLNCALTQTDVSGNSTLLQTKLYWKKVNDTLFLKNGKSITVSDSGKYIFHVKDTINLCISKDTVVIKLDQLKPIANAKVDKDVSCKNLEVIIDASLSSQGPGIVYQWTTANGNIVSGANSVAPLVNKGGDYLLEVDNTNNYCKSNTVAIVYEQTKPSAGFEQQIAGLDVQFNDQSIGIPKSWNWSFGDGTFSKLKNPNHTYGLPGDYDVCLNIENDCGQDTICTKISVGISAATLTCPTNISQTACQTQAEIDSKFATWLTTASFSGGCNPSLTNNNTGSPPACGGSTQVTFTLTSSCDSTIKCSANFSVINSPSVFLNCTSSQSEAACQSQATIDSKFAAWLSTASFTGGCNATFSNNNKGAPPACGGSTTVSFLVTSSCESPKTCTATFTVMTSPTLVLTCPKNQTEESGQTQTQIDQKFAAWLASANVEGGCNPSMSNNNNGAPPSTGGSTIVNFDVSSSCEPNITCSANFTVKQATATVDPGIVRQFELTPNPVNGSGVIHIQFDQQRNYNINMLNVYGDLIWTHSSFKIQEDLLLDLSYYSKGLYFIVLHSDNKQVALKWIVE